MPSLRKLAAMKKTQSRKTKILHNERERVWKDALTYSHHLKRRKDILSIISRSFKSFKSKLVLKSDAEFFTRVKREKPSETARSELAYLSPKITKLEQSLWSEIHVLVTKNKLGSIFCALFWRFRGFLSETIGPEFPRSFERRGFYRCDETARSYQIFVVYSRRTTEMSSSDKYATHFLLLCAFFHRKSTAESHFNFFSSATFLVFLVLKSIQQHSKEEEAIRISLRIANFTQQCSSYWWSYRTNESTFEKSNLALAFLFLVRTFLSGLRMSIFRLKTRQFNLKSNAIQSKEKKNCSSSIEFVFFSLCPRHSLSQKQPVQTREEISSSSSLFLDCKTTFSSKKKKKTPSFPSKKESITRAWKSKPYARIARVNTVFAFRAFFHLFSCTRSGSGSKVYERFFFLFCVFSRVFFSREKIVPLLLLFLLLFFLLLSRETLFSGGEKKKRKNISLERSARFRPEREKNIRTTTYAREVQKERKLSPLLLLPSLFLSLLCCSFRGGEQSVSSVCDKKGVLEYFRDDRPKRERSEEKRKRKGSGFSWNCPKPKGRKKIQNTCLHTKLFITYTRCCAYHQPAADQTYYRCLGAIIMFILLFLLRWERAGAEKE